MCALQHIVLLWAVYRVRKIWLPVFTVLCAHFIFSSSRHAAHGNTDMASLTRLVSDWQVWDPRVFQNCIHFLTAPVVPKWFLLCEAPESPKNFIHLLGPLGESHRNCIHFELSLNLEAIWWVCLSLILHLELLNPKWTKRVPVWNGFWQPRVALNILLKHNWSNRLIM